MDIDTVINQKSCNLPGDLKTVDTVSIKTILERDFENPHAMKALECIISLIINTSKVGDTISDRVNGYLTDTTSTESSGAYGQILFTHMIKDAEVVIKTIKIKKGEQYDQDDRTMRMSDMKEEYLKALIINKMRFYIPTYNYTLGFFNCKTFTESKSKVKLCPKTGTPNSFMVVEKIVGGTLSDLLSKKQISTIEKFIEIYMQVLMSLELGQRTIKFCHWDLHSQNVMIKNKPAKYRVFLDNSTYEFDVSATPVLIDYGLSSVTDEAGNTYGTSDFEDNGRFNYLVPAHDMYWLLMHCYDHMPSSSTFKRQAANLFEFFGPNAPYKPKQGERICKDYGDNIYNSPVASKTPLEFFKWIQRNYNLPFLRENSRDAMYSLYMVPSRVIYHQLLKTSIVPENISNCLKDLQGLILCGYFAQILSKMGNQFEFQRLDAFIKSNNAALVAHDEKMLGGYKGCPRVPREFKAEADKVLGRELGGFSRSAKLTSKSLADDFISKYEPIFNAITSFVFLMVIIKEVRLVSGIYEKYIRDLINSDVFRDYIEHYPSYIVARRWCNTLISY